SAEQRSAGGASQQGKNRSLRKFQPIALVAWQYIDEPDIQLMSHTEHDRAPRLALELFHQRKHTGLAEKLVLHPGANEHDAGRRMKYVRGRVLTQVAGNG